MFFQKTYLDLTVAKQKSNIRTLRKKLGKRVKQNYYAAFSHLKKVIWHRSKIFVSSDKERERGRERVKIKNYLLQSVIKYLRLTVVFMPNSAQRETFNRYFSGLFY